MGAGVLKSRVRVARLPEVNREVWRLLTTRAVIEQMGKLGWSSPDRRLFSRQIRPYEGGGLERAASFYAVVSPARDDGFLLGQDPTMLGWMVFARGDRLLMGGKDAAALLVLWTQLLGWPFGLLCEHPRVLLAGRLPLLTAQAPNEADFRGSLNWVFPPVVDLGSSLRYQVAVNPQMPALPYWMFSRAHGRSPAEYWAQHHSRRKPRWRVELREFRGSPGVAPWSQSLFKLDEWILSGGHETAAAAVAESGLMWWPEDGDLEALKGVWEQHLLKVRRAAGPLVLEVPLESYALLGLESPLLWNIDRFKEWIEALD